MQLHRSVHTFRQLEWLPQKAQRFIRFAPLLSVKLFRKLFALENAKVNKYAPRFWPISICHNPFLLAVCVCCSHFILAAICMDRRTEKEAPCGALINHLSGCYRNAKLLTQGKYYCKHHYWNFKISIH